MKVEDIEAFVATIRCQSISLAAESLQLTQPAISRRVQNIEEALGAVLLDRNTKPLKPTALGLKVYDQCRAVLREVDLLQQLVSGHAGDVPAFRIGVSQSVGDAVLVDTLRLLKKTHPHLQLTVLNGWSGALEKRLEMGELDAAIVLFPSGKVFANGVAAESLGRMKLVVVAPKGEGAQLRKLAHCHERGWILNPDGCGFRAGLQRALSERGLSFKVNMETFGTEVQLGLVANGLGYGLVPAPLLERSKYASRLDVLSLSDFKPVIELWLIHSRFSEQFAAPVELIASYIRGDLTAA